MKTKYFIIGLIIVIVFIQYVIWGGFGSCDDLALVNQMMKTSSFSEMYLNMNHSYSSYSRIISNFTLTLSLFFFRDSPIGYIIVQVLLWLASVLVIAYSLKPFFNQNFPAELLLILAFPSIAASFIFIPYSSGIPLAVLLWAISLLFLKNYTNSNNRFHYFLTYFFLFCSLLSYEFCLPLFIIQALNPYYFVNQSNHKFISQNIKKVLIKFTLPVVNVVLFITLLKFFLTNLYSTSLKIPYGFQAISSKSILQGLYWFFAVIIEIPILLFSVLPYMLNTTVVLAIISIIFLFIIEKRVSSSQEKHQTVLPSSHKYFITIILLCLISCPIIYIISGYPAVTYGAYNRLMLPTHILLCIIVGFSYDFLKRKWWSNLLLRIFSILWISSFIIQQDHYIRSWQERKIIFANIVEKCKENNLKKKSVIIACVPFYFQKNYNNEEIFWLSWDFIGGLSLYGINAQGFPMNYYSLVDDDQIFIDEKSIRYRFSNIKLDNDLWYYEYDLASRKSKLIQVNDKHHLLEIFDTIKKIEINKNQRCIRENIRLRLKKLI